jgi:multiple sugar transport system ATP-binding protein
MPCSLIKTRKEEIASVSKIEVQELAKTFADNLVVDRVSFHVNDGEFFVLLGPSGGGKSTILRLICGLEQPDSGQIHLGGRDVTQLNPRQRNVGMVFQDYGLYPSMDVYGNIAYGLENRHMPKAEIQQRVQEAAEKLKLTPLLRREIAGLSGGEQQRVALARILARDADIFLYDEPLANLDPKLRYQARRDILAVHKLRKVPSIYVTHDQAEAFAIGDRIAVIAHGRLQQVGTPSELLESPANVFMARFIGSPPMNLLPGEWQIDEAQALVQVQGQSWTLPEKWRSALTRQQNAELMVGIPPQAIVPPWQLADAEDGLCVLNAEVTELEPLIGEIVVYLKLESGVTLAALWPEPETLPGVGETLRAGVDPQTFYLFDAQTEQVLETCYT